MQLDSKALHACRYTSAKRSRTVVMTYKVSGDLYYVASWKGNANDTVLMRKCQDHWILQDGGGYANTYNTVGNWRRNHHMKEII